MEAEQLQEQNGYMPVHLRIVDASCRKGRNYYVLELNIERVQRDTGK